MNGVVGGLLIEGSLKVALDQLLEKGLIGFLRKFRRLARVSKAFDLKKAPLPPPIATALADIETVVGSRKGILTESLQGFLLALRDTELPIRLAEAGFLAQPSPGTFAAFRTLFELHFGGNRLDVGRRFYTAKELYEAIVAMLATSIREQGMTAEVYYESGFALRRAQDMYSKRDALLWDVFEPKLQNKGDARTLAAWITAAPADARNILREFAEKIRPEYASIWVEGPADRGQRDVPAEQIFVACQLQLMNANATDVEDSTAIELDDIWRLFHRAVIVGDPGGGKSTHAQMLCLQTLDRCAGGLGPLALKVDIRKFEAALLQQAQLPLTTFLIRELARITNDVSDNVEPAVRYFLNLGLVFVIFDGLDEITAISRRRDFVSAVNNFCSIFPLARVLVTSRKIGYPQAPLPSSVFPILQLSRFTLSEIEAYVDKSSKVIFGKNEEEIRAAVEVFTNPQRSEGSDLKTNPLMLALMVWLYHERRGDLPNDRAKIYKECSLLMFQRWDYHRSIETDIPAEFDLLDLLSFLASKIYVDSTLAAGVGKNWLTSTIEEFFLAIFTYDAIGRSRRAAQKVVDFITGRAWVMTDKGAEIYDFTHRTFLEFFFARHLHDAYETADLVKLLAPRIARGQWNVPSHLSIQLTISDRPSATKVIVRGLLDNLEKKPKKTEDTISFLLELVQYLPAPERELEEIGFRIGELLLQERITDQFADQIVQPNNVRRLAIYRGVSQGITKSLIAGNTQAWCHIDNWANEIQWPAEMMPDLPPRRVERKDVEEEKVLFEIISGDIKNFLQAQTSAALVKFAFDIGRNFLPDLSYHGIRLWSIEYPYHERMNVAAVDWYFMFEHLLASINGKHGASLSPYVRLAQMVTPAVRQNAPNAWGVGSNIIVVKVPPSPEWASLCGIKSSELDQAVLTVALMLLELRRFGCVDFADHTGGIQEVIEEALTRVAALGTPEVEFFKRYKEKRIKLLA